MKTKQVKDLQAGDKLSDGREIVGKPLELTHTPKGKMEVCVRYPDGKKRAHLWGKYTTLRLQTEPESIHLCINYKAGDFNKFFVTSREVMCCLTGAGKTIQDAIDDFLRVWTKNYGFEPKYTWS